MKSSSKKSWVAVLPKQWRDKPIPLARAADRPKVAQCHGLANAVRHEPCGLVGHSKDAVKLMEVCTMAARSISKTVARELESAAIQIDQGLTALHELANTDGVSLDTLATCCEQMTSAMLVKVRTLYKIADAEGCHG
jgi:hypothetical protein